MAGGITIFVLVLIAAGMFYRYNQKQKKLVADYKLPANAESLLQEYVPFYKELDEANRKVFLNRIHDFLATTVINPVGDTVVEDMDSVFIAAGAIIPIFAFPDWKYNNIDEVLLYKTSFSDKYKTIGEGRNILGMVGDGALNRTMLLSQQAVRQGFMQPDDGRNTVIHEFTHLLDKADGSVDGVPEYLLSKQYIIPWVKEMHKEIKYMRDWGNDINPYGATNEAEFFAVVSEYFFERPHQLAEHHPELYALLQEMFTRHLKPQETA